jgi:hypothetical protein
LNLIFQRSSTVRERNDLNERLDPRFVPNDRRDVAEGFAGAGRLWVVNDELVTSELPVNCLEHYL